MFLTKRWMSLKFPVEHGVVPNTGGSSPDPPSKPAQAAQRKKSSRSSPTKKDIKVSPKPRGSTKATTTKPTTTMKTAQVQSTSTNGLQPAPSDDATVHLQLIDRVQAIPLVELAVSKSASTYARIKDSHQLLGWALGTAESSLCEAKRQAAPYAKRLEAPIGFVDQKLCRGLDLVEEKVPIVKQQPATIIEDAYMAAVYKMAPAIKSMNDIGDFLRAQTNEMLGTYYGSKAIDTLDSTAGLIDALIDRYFPPLEDEKDSSSVDAHDDDKLMHVLQTIGRLPVKAARRVYARISKQLPKLSADGLKGYASNLLEFLRLANFIGAGTAIADSSSKPSSSSPSNHVSFEPDRSSEATAAESN